MAAVLEGNDGDEEGLGGLGLSASGANGLLAVLKISVVGDGDAGALLEEGAAVEVLSAADVGTSGGRALDGGCDGGSVGGAVVLEVSCSIVGLALLLEVGAPVLLSG